MLAMAPETRAMKKQKTGPSSSVHLISSGSSSSGGSGSRSRSPSPHSGGDGDTVESGGHHVRFPSSGSEHSSDSKVSVPEALLAEPDWCGYAADARMRCYCGKRAVRKVAWGGKDTGRRFYGCDDEGDSGSFVEWVDDPWTSRVQKTICDLNSVIDSWRADCTDAEEEAAEAKAVAEKLKGKLDKAKVQVQVAQAERNIAMQLRNDAVEEKEELIKQKEAIAAQLDMYKREAVAQAAGKKKAWFMTMGLVLVQAVCMLMKKK